jgi:Spy/CpxP family protein refolding chaperone
MRSIRFRLLVAAMAVLLGTAIAKSQTAEEAPPPPPTHAHAHGYGMGYEMGFFAHALNLTDTQKAQMKTIMEKEKPTMKPLFQQSHQIDQQLRQYVEGSYDEAKVRALATQKAQLEVEMTVQRTRIHNELYQLLTTDQQAKLKEMETRHEARMQQHMQAAPAPPAQD